MKLLSFLNPSHEKICCRSVVAQNSLIYCLLHALPTNFCWVIADVCCVGWLSITMPSYSKESSFLSYANAKHFLLLKKKSCGKADIKSLILKCRNSSSAYSTVLRELQDLLKDRLPKPVNVFPIRFSKDVWDRYTLTQKGRGFADSAWRSEVIRNLKLVNTTCSFGFKGHAVWLKESKRLHIPLFKCEGYCTLSACNVQFKLHINEDFQGKVSFQGKMPVNLSTICHLRLFVARTQINSWNVHLYA